MIGFISSIVLTLAAYTLVDIHINSLHETISHEVLIPTIMVLAFVQLLIQLIYFLHLNRESGPRWNLFVFLSTAALLVVVIGGSLWIMNHLNYHMTPVQMNQYMQDHQGGF